MGALLGFWSAASIPQPAAMIEEMAGSARRNDYRQFPGFAVKRVVAAVRLIVPRNLVVANACRIRIHGAPIIVDFNLPAGTAGRIGAGDHSLAVLRLTVSSENGHAGRQSSDPWPAHEHSCTRMIFPITECKLPISYAKCRFF